MIGQEKLLNRINSFTLDTFPRSSLILGDIGSGKHLIVNYIQDNIIKFPVLDITDKLSSDYIDNIYTSVNPNIYLINIDSITDTAQNVILKVLEEPPVNAFIILLSSNKNTVLDTVINRCITFELAQYTKEELKQFAPEDLKDESILDIITTPGQLLLLHNFSLKSVIELTDKIIDKIHLASFPNLLSIVDKINISDTPDKFDLNILLGVLMNNLYSRYLINNDTFLLNMYKTVREYKEKLRDTRLNREYLIESLLIKLQRLAVINR